MVWYKKAEKQKDHNKMDIRWEKGIWLGHTRDWHSLAYLFLFSFSYLPT